MKTFFYTIEIKNRKVTNTVFQVKNNIPVLIGTRHYNIGYYRGHDHEAMQVIIDNKKLPKNVMDSPKYGYI